MSGLPAACVVPVAVTSDPADRLSALFDAHHKRLYRLARRLAPHADDALDLVQETFLRVLRGPISTSAVISGDFTQAEAERIANGISIR